MMACAGNSPLSFDGKWCVTSIEGEQVVPSDETPYIAFKGMEVEGFTGCNRLTGNVNVEQLLKGEADFSGIAATMMACPEDKYETRFLAALAKAKGVKLTKEGFVLLDADGAEVLSFKKQ